MDHHTHTTPLTEGERATLVLRSQGMALLILQGLEPRELTELASLCDSQGQLADDVRGRFDDWRLQYYESRKATASDDADAAEADTEGAAD